jgi:hypothetical protein
MGVGSIDFSTTDPKKIAQANRQWGLTSGQELMDQAGAWNIERGQKADQTSNQIQGLFDPTGRKSSLDSYLNPAATTSRLDSWMTPLANGQGGYNADELSQIRMSPEEQQGIITGAGISAGLRNSAAVGAAERASAAAGGNPQALATYRARAAAQGAADAGDAMTNARVAASNAAAGRAQTIGNTRIGQQNTGLGYYQGLQGQGTNYLTGQLTGGQNYLGNLQQQQAGQQESALGRQMQAYGTASGAANNSAETAQKASQNPTTFDKIMGGVSGAVSAFLEEGDVMPAAKTPAVIGENGPEKVVSTGREYMEGGAVIPSLFSRIPPPRDLGTTTPNADGSLVFTPGADSAPDLPSLYRATPAAPGPRDLGTTTTNADGSLTFAPGADSTPGLPQRPGGFRGFLSRLKEEAAAQNGQAAAPQQPPAIGGANTYRNIASAAGKLAGRFLEEGDVMPQGANGIFTQPTRVNLAPGEAVVPLSYRASAKVRPSQAALPAAPVTYRGGRNNVVVPARP